MIKKKYHKYILLILISLFLLTGCYSKEEKILAEQYRKQGQINAINYVKAKYGFTAKVKDVEEEAICNPTWGCLDSSPSGKVTVKLNVNKKDFYVYVTGKEESVDAYDDYQIDEIEKDLIKFFKNNISIKLYDYQLTFNVKGIKEYYNDNLEIILPYIKNIELYYINKDDLNTLNLDKIKNLLQTYSATLEIINFKTKENLNEYKNVKTDNPTLSSKGIPNIYKDSSLKLYQGNINFTKYNISNYNNDVYIYAPQENTHHTISISTLDDLNNYKNLHTDLSDKKLKQVSDAYSIHYTKALLYIYFPKDKVNAKDDDKIFYVYECNVDGIKKYYINNYYGENSKLKITSMGNYYITQDRYSYCDSNSEIIFSLIKISD